MNRQIDLFCNRMVLESLGSKLRAVEDFSKTIIYWVVLAEMGM